MRWEPRTRHRRYAGPKPRSLMKSHEIFQHMSPALAAEILGYLQKTQTPVFKSVVQTLASQRNLRSVFVERKPPNERYTWIKSALGRRSADTLAAHLLQAWLLGAQKAMLCDFLDSLGIAHDPDGTVEQLPDSPPKERLREVIDEIFCRFDPHGQPDEMIRDSQTDPIGPRHSGMRCRRGTSD